MRRSLTARIAWLTSMLAVLTTAVTASIVIAVYEEAAMRDFEAVLTAHVYTLVAGTRLDDSGRPAGDVSLGLGDARFDQPGSGWGWSVETIEATGAEGAAVRSSSLAGISVPLPVDPPEFDDFYRRAYSLDELAGPDLRAVETEVELDQEGRAARFRVFGNLDEFEENIALFSRVLLLKLSTFAVTGVIASIFLVRFGLKPLDEARRSLKEAREGNASELSTDVPREIEPLVDEINALISSNRRIVERARVQVGNLAHGLKTPLAVTLNEASQVGGDAGRALEEQARRMRAQIDTYLDRARIAAGVRVGLASTDVRETIEGVVRAVRRISPDRRIEFEQDETIVFDGEKHDLEEVVGNLIENAAKWARRLVFVQVGSHAASEFVLSVEDDGPGMSDAEAADALQRGARLDEAVEGSGLGLSIVRDIVSEYGGRFELGRSEAGGLSARVWLPSKRGG